MSDIEMKENETEKTKCVSEIETPHTQKCSPVNSERDFNNGKKSSYGMSKSTIVFEDGSDYIDKAEKLERGKTKRSLDLSGKTDSEELDEKRLMRKKRVKKVSETVIDEIQKSSESGASENVSKIKVDETQKSSESDTSKNVSKIKGDETQKSSESGDSENVLEMKGGKEVNDENKKSEINTDENVTEIEEHSFQSEKESVSGEEESFEEEEVEEEEDDEHYDDSNNEDVESEEKESSFFDEERGEAEGMLVKDNERMVNVRKSKNMFEKRSRNQLSSSSDSDPVSDRPKEPEVQGTTSRGNRLKLKRCLSLPSAKKDNRNCDVRGKDSRSEGEDNEEYSHERKESLSEFDEIDDSSSPLRREFETTDSESDDSDQEDFPTEGLLKELHFLNASCERPSQGHRTPKKQKRYDTKGLEGSRSNTPIDKKTKRKLSPLKKPKDIMEREDDPKLESAGSPSKGSLKTDSDEVDSNDSNEESLHIVGDEENSRKRKSSMPDRAKKKPRTMDSGDVPQEVIELIQSGIDEVLEEKAERTHLTAVHVKNIIKNVMTDENVLAMVRNTVLGINTMGGETSAVYEPTLTRAKTKEIIQQQADGTGKRSIWAELSKTNTNAGTSLNPETRALVTTDFPDEDEDDEYTPDADEHMHSDDESFISPYLGSSHFESPTTPLSCCTPSSQQSVDTPKSASDVNSQALHPDKGLQLLRQKNAQRMLNFEPPLKKEELMSQRTRSKLPLTETPLECLEMAFKPPDVTNDMYESEVLDENWKTFLIDFIHPLKNTEGVEDEEADPEYNILEDKEDANDLREEMRGDRAVQISKKEINDLVTELLGTLDSDEEGTEPVRKHLSQHINIQKRKTTPVKIIEPVAVTEDGPPSNTIWVEVLLAKFTPYQLDILRYQMAHHVQLLTTTVLMCDGFSSTIVADSATNMLDELWNTGNISDYNSTFFHSFNLNTALTTLKHFKEKNPDLPTRKEPKKSYSTIDLNQRVIEAILESSCFPFPNLLPRRLFNEPTSNNKAVFLPSEDMLVVMGLLNHLSLEDQSGKSVKKLPNQICSALQESMKDTVIHKTVHQVQTRVKNMRRRIKEHVLNQNPLAIFYDTGKLTPPSAAMEPVLPFVPCPVKDYPENVLQDPWKKIVIKRQKISIKAAQEAALYQEKLNQELRDELRVGGLRPLQKSGQNIVIIQSNGTSTQVRLPTHLTAIAPKPVSSAHSYSVSPYVTVMDGGISNVSSPVSYPVAIVKPTVVPLPTSNSTPPVSMPGEVVSSASTSIDSCEKSHSISQCNPDTRSEEGKSKTPTTADDEMLTADSVDLVPLPTVVSSKETFCESPTDSPMTESAFDDSNSNRAKLVVDVSSPSNSEALIREKNVENKVRNSCIIESDEDSYDVTKEQAAMSEFMSSVNNSDLVDSDQIDNISTSGDVTGIENCLELPLETPQKSPPPSPVNITTPHLHMPSLLSTPEKVPSKGDAGNLSVCLLDVPLVTFPSGQSPTSLKKLKGQSPSSSSVVTLLTESKSRKSEESNQQLEKENSRTRNICDEKEIANNSSTVSKGSKDLLLSDQQGDMEKDGGKIANALSGVYGSPDVTSTTLITSVYQSTISSSGVGVVEKVRQMPSVSPQKTICPYRKNSPAKILRSPIKTSPMKKISPILRKYGYRQKIRPCNKKLSPILPKLTPQKPQRIRSSAQRRLAPKSAKEESSTPGSQIFHPSGGNESNPLVQMDDELVMDSDASSDPGHLRTEIVHQLEEEFEEDYLEEEEEEEEEEEDDSEAAQQREEHLAALLKASSTIVGKKCERLSGGDIGPAERRLNKQQKRLQARITALSIVQDSLAKDKSMAQSYLMRVREALTGKDPLLYKKFLGILNEFTETATNSPVELYDQLREVLKDFPLLTKEFVSFLLPQQAIAIGKYSQYCAIHRMRDFLEKLKLQFRKQPQYIQKIIRVLQSFQNRSDMDFEKVKASICPLLRYPHLVESFSQCFASQPPPPSLTNDFEDISLERSHTPDSVENLVLPDDDAIMSPDYCGCPCHVSGPSPPNTVSSTNNSSTSSVRSDHCQSCAIRFSEGRVYLQHGKTLRPAKVTYHSLESDSGNNSKENKECDRHVKDPQYVPDDCEVTVKGKGVVPRKTSYQRESSDGVLTKCKESSIDNVYVLPENRGLTTVGDKGFKDDLSNQAIKQSSGKGRFDETAIKEEARIGSNFYRKESVGVRSSHPKKMSSKTNEEKGDDCLLNVDSATDTDTDLNSLKSNNKCAIAGLLSRDVQEDNSILLNSRVQNIHSSSSSSHTLESGVKVSSLQSDVDEKLRSSHSPRESLVIAKRNKDHLNISSTGNKNDISSVSVSKVDSLSNPNTYSSHSSQSNIFVGNKQFDKDNVAKLSSISVTSCEWTRDEDKIILTTIQGKETADSIIQEIMKVMPSRTYDEVLERFNVLVRLMMEEADMEDISFSEEDVRD